MTKSEVKTETKLNKNFWMIFFDVWEYTGIFGIDFLIYLIQKAGERGDNKITCISDEKIARDLNKTKKTISNAKHILHDAGILKYETKMIFLNPSALYFGDLRQRKNVIIEYMEYVAIRDKEDINK